MAAIAEATTGDVTVESPPAAVVNPLPVTAEIVGDSALNTKAPPISEELHATDSSDNLPEVVKRRLKALKRLQLETTNLEAKFYEEVQKLEVKYHLMYTPIFEKRAEIVMGQYEPTELECQWDLDSDSDDEDDKKKKDKDKDKDKDAKAKDKSGDKKEETEKEKVEKPKLPDDVKGIPDFWLTIFKNVQMLSEMVQEYDEPILKHLTDIKVEFLEDNPMTFLLKFYFSPNDYFTDEMLTKEYEMKCTPDEEDPFSFEGPEIYKCKGCAINWKKGQNVTVKLVKKKQKHKSRGVVRTVVKAVQRDSFFNFFSPPALPDDPDAEVDDETYALVTSDIETGHYIRERIVPRAVLYYTGEALDEEDFEDDLSSSEGDSSSSEGDDDEDEDEDDEETVEGEEEEGGEEKAAAEEKKPE